MSCQELGAAVEACLCHLDCSIHPRQFVAPQILHYCHFVAAGELAVCAAGVHMGSSMGSCVSAGVAVVQHGGDEGRKFLAVAAVVEMVQAKGDWVDLDKCVVEDLFGFGCMMSERCPAESTT